MTVNLHLATDEKFVDFVIHDVTRLNMLRKNHFYIYTDSDQELKYVKSKMITRVTVNSPQWTALFNQRIVEYERVFIHYLDIQLFPLLGLIPKEIKVSIGCL